MGKKISLSNRQVAAPGEQASRATVNQVNLAIQGKLDIPAHFDVYEAIKAGAEVGDLFQKLRVADGVTYSTGVIIPVTKEMFELFEASERIPALERSRDSIQKSIDAVLIEITASTEELAKSEAEKDKLSSDLKADKEEVEVTQKQVNDLEKDLIEAKKAGDKALILKIEGEIEEGNNKIAIIWERYRTEEKDLSKIGAKILALKAAIEALEDKEKKLADADEKVLDSLKQVKEKEKELNDNIRATGSDVCDDIARMALDAAYPIAPVV